ncbi:MAG: sugar ABC transporter ATP-binding protein, partial [Planctomycetes bacterium]|nr:sugar ABC transporter ATP-binding protein [Planctomycetota bacterium]
PFIDHGYEAELATDAIANLGIATAGGRQRVSLLSGGNQQKVVLGKWLAAEPAVLLLDEPTRGVDVRARAEIHARLDALAAAGMAVLFVSSELEEVIALADRVLVMHRGRISGEVPYDRLGEEAIMRLCVGMTAAVGGER